MKREPNFGIFLQTFSSRIETALAIHGALSPSTDDLALLKQAYLDIEAALAEIGHGCVEDQYRAYSVAVGIFVILAEWKHAIRNAVPDAQRFLISAKLKASEVDKSNLEGDKRLVAFLDGVRDLNTVDGLVALQDQLKRWALPLLLFADVAHQQAGKLRIPRTDSGAEESENCKTTVAFLKFDIDGKPAKQWNYLNPGTAYDLTIEVRVSNWPDGARFLLVTPVTLDVRERHWLPSFKFERPPGDGPFILGGTGRAILEVAHSFGSRPYEFLYAAEFDDLARRGDVAVVGHRRLLLEGADIATNPLTGFAYVDRHLLRIRDKLRAFPGLHSNDVSNAMTVLGGLGNISAQALKSGLFEASTSEQQFQKKVTEMLRSRSEIGEHLQGHPEAAGGVTDLTFRDLPVELKVENKKVMFPRNFTKFFDQTAAYAIGLGKRIGLLCVLEASPKSEPVGVVEEDIEVFAHTSGRSTVAIIVIVIRGGFPKPSSYSK